MYFNDILWEVNANEIINEIIQAPLYDMMHINIFISFYEFVK